MLARVARGEGLPFSPNAETVEALEAAGRGEVFSADTVEEFLAALNADD
jgi:antitoxin component of RelBE/YafQ-DinJ toxin-antitoxin module